jgi:phage antirepressor YoqD-like protein
MNELTEYGDKKIITDEVCRVLGCDKSTLMRNWREIESVVGAATVKNIEHGKPTYWTETEITLLLEKMKGNANNQHDLASSLQGIETSKSRVLQLQILQKQMQDIYEAEIAELKAKTEADRPKVEFFDQVADSKDAIQMRDVAAVLNIPGWGRNKIFALLRQLKILDNRNIPYRAYQDKGYFRVIEQEFTDSEGETHINLKTLVYQSGVDFVRKVILRQEKGAA